MADFATALAAIPGMAGTTPTDVTVDGHRGKAVTLTAPTSSAGCTLAAGQYFRVWIRPLGGSSVNPCDP